MSHVLQNVIPGLKSTVRARTSDSWEFPAGWYVVRERPTVRRFRRGIFAAVNDRVCGVRCDPSREVPMRGPGHPRVPVGEHPVCLSTREHREPLRLS